MSLKWNIEFIHTHGLIHRMQVANCMMTSSNGNIFRVTGHLCGEIPAQRPVMWSFDVFFDLRLNENLINNREAGDLRRYRAHYDVIVMEWLCTLPNNGCTQLNYPSNVIGTYSSSFVLIAHFSCCNMKMMKNTRFPIDSCSIPALSYYALPKFCLLVWLSNGLSLEQLFLY